MAEPLLVVVEPIHFKDIISEVSKWYMYLRAALSGCQLDALPISGCCHSYISLSFLYSFQCPAIATKNVVAEQLHLEA